MDEQQVRAAAVIAAAVFLGPRSAPTVPVSPEIEVLQEADRLRELFELAEEIAAWVRGG